MISHRTVAICLIAGAITITGCGGGEGTDTETNGTDPIITDDDALTDNDVVTEPDAEADNDVVVTDSDATPVVPVSTEQMDSYIDNPLLAQIPAELANKPVNSPSRSYLINPLLN